MIMGRRSSLRLVRTILLSLSGAELYEPVFHGAGTSAACVLLNHNASAFFNRKALPAKARRREKSSTLNAEILSFIEAEDADGLTPVKDDNKDNGQKIQFKAGSYNSAQLKLLLKLPIL